MGLHLQVSGTPIPGNLVVFDANGFATDGGAVPGGITSIAVAALQALVTGGTLTPGALYGINNPQQGGTIVIGAASATQLNKSATWLRNTNLPAFGWIRLTAGSAGSVNTVTVNGVNVMTASVPFNTDRNTTATNVATNIAANSGVSGWTAMAILDTVVLIATTASSAVNTQAVSGTATTITLGNIQNIIGGVNPSIQALSIDYDIAADRVRRCYDPVSDNEMYISEAFRTQLSFDPFNEFRWGDVAFAGNYMNDAYIRNLFFVTANTVVRNYLHTKSIIENAVGSTNAFIFDVSGIDDTGLCQNNLCLGTGSNIGRMILAGLCSNNILTGTNSNIQMCDILNHSSTAGSGINGNTLSGSTSQITSCKINATSGAISNNVLSNTSAQIRFIEINSLSSVVNANTLSGVSSNIFGCKIMGASCTISSNTISSANGSIRNCMLFGDSTAIMSNTISGTATNCGIRYCQLNGNAATISSNTINHTSSTLSNGITDCILNGNASGINSINFNTTAAAGVKSVTLDATSAIFTGITFDATLFTIQNIHWTRENKIRYNIIKTGLTGAANNGQSASNINLAWLPVSKCYFAFGTFEGNGLTGVASTIEVGIETDGTQAFIPTTTIAALGSNPAIINVPGSAIGAAVSNGTSIAVKSTVTNRRIVAVPGVANITAGAFQCILEVNVSNF